MLGRSTLGNKLRKKPFRQCHWPQKTQRLKGKYYPTKKQYYCKKDYLDKKKYMIIIWSQTLIEIKLSTKRKIGAENEIQELSLISM